MTAFDYKEILDRIGALLTGEVDSFTPYAQDLLLRFRSYQIGLNATWVIVSALVFITCAVLIVVSFKREWELADFIIIMSWVIGISALCVLILTTINLFKAIYMPDLCVLDTMKQLLRGL